MKCLSAGCDMPEDHCGITCTQGHHICQTCAPAFVDFVMESFDANFHCPNCRADILPLTFERQLDDTQRSVWLTFLAVKEVAVDEVLRTCPLCPYFELNLKVDGIPQFFHCPNDGSAGRAFGGKACGATTCGFCLKRVVPVSEADERGDRAAYEAKLREPEVGMMQHFECGELYPYLAKVQAALSQTMVDCPLCGLKGGYKNNACTHMTCPNCTGQWCYLCVKPRTECDGATAASFMGHNANWQTVAGRCPLYLDSVCIEASAANPSWPALPTDALDHSLSDKVVAHVCRQRALRALKRAYTEMGAGMYERLLAKYGCVRACGYTIAEIVGTDVTMPLFNKL